ncbi:hypothetical protein, partial [Intestinimonas butyriciproducens]|uniref:hypothetical protein n=1 Tax=Intestinimonas butyriciproducens TaxID=1297617 RepID=UPI00195DF3E8
LRSIFPRSSIFLTTYCYFTSCKRKSPAFAGLFRQAETVSKLPTVFLFCPLLPKKMQEPTDVHLKPNRNPA